MFLLTYQGIEEIDVGSFKEALFKQGLSTPLRLAIHNKEDKTLSLQFIREPSPEEKTLCANVLAAFPRYPLFDMNILETVMITPYIRHIESKQDWEDLGGVILDTDNFKDDNIRGLVSGELRSSGGNGEIILRMEGLNTLDLSDPAKLKNTQDNWIPFSYLTDRSSAAGAAPYVLYARRNTAKELMFRRVTLSLVTLS